jgi:hypothetical protein
MHAISVYLLRKEDIRDEKISQVLDNKNELPKYTELNCGIVAMINIPNLKEFGKDKMIARIETDYFGGSGEQSAELFINNEYVYNQNSYADRGSRPINDVLKKMGVVKHSGMDEFDTIHLGRYGVWDKLPNWKELRKYY